MKGENTLKNWKNMCTKLAGWEQTLSTSHGTHHLGLASHVPHLDDSISL
jgi:hypothetical protein